MGRICVRFNFFKNQSFTNVLTEIVIGGKNPHLYFVAIESVRFFIGPTSMEGRPKRNEMDIEAGDKGEMTLDRSGEKCHAI
jgi:hypothetical protein